MSRRITAPVLPRVAALYCRVSSKRQAEDDKTSLKTQLDALRMKAAEVGYAVTDAHIYQDAHSGEVLHQRPGLARMRDDARAGLFGVVIAYNVYALAKNQVHIAVLLDEWQHLGIELQFVTEELEDTPLGRLILNARTFAAEVEGERRKDRMQRALRARVDGGMAVASARPPYGYQWRDDERGANGRLLRKHLIKNPETWPVVERIWRDALMGRTLRSIATALAVEGVPTASGRAPRWGMGAVRYILTNPVYWGKPMAFRRQLVPVEPHLLSKYTYKSRPVTRPLDEQVPLPDDFAPPVVTPEIAAQVHARLTMNKRMATPSSPDPQELLRGIARCGYCGHVLAVRHLRPGMRTARDGFTKTATPARTVYGCRTANRYAGACKKHGIAAHKLDSAVWEAVADELRHPERLEAEVDLMRETGDPSAPTRDAIDRQLADVRRKILNKRKYAEDVDDDRERKEVAAEVTLLRERERALEDECAATLAYFANWQRVQDGLVRTLDVIARAEGNLDTFTLAERREAVLSLGAQVNLYATDHTPRVECTLYLPITGLVSLGGISACNLVNSIS